MDWPLAIDRNRDALRRIIAALFALAGLAPGGTLKTLPRQLFYAVLFILRPTESAVRRLIVIAARGLVLTLRASRPLPASLPAFSGAGAMRAPAFALIDPLKHFDPEAIWDAAPPPLLASVPDFHDPNWGYREFSSPDEPVNAGLIARRLNALKRALDDLPRQARRLVRWQAKRDLALKGPFRPMRMTPFRPGLPPGWRQRPLHEIDHVLRECHGLALDAMERRDTS